MKTIPFPFLSRGILFFCLLFTTSLSQAQKSYFIRGTVADSTGMFIQGATIKYNAHNDSIIAVTDQRGNFSFNKVQSDRFYISIKALGYEALKQQFFKKDFQGDTVFLAVMILKQRSILLKEVAIKSKPMPIIMKRDTIEYDAGSFENNNDNVIADLVSRLPGLQLNKDGTVSSQGVTLSRITVNGKDFFTGNISEYIRELPADIVSKIQIVTDYGKQASFTGIKTGISEKVLNVVFKRGINAGTFGMVSALGQLHQAGASGNANYWHDMQQIEVNGASSTPSRASGISAANGFGMVYRDALSKPLTVNVNYKLTHNAINTNTTTFTQTNDINGIINSSNDNEYHTTALNHELGINLNYTADTSSFFAFSPTLSFASTDNTNAIDARENGAILESISSSSVANVRTPSFGGSISFSHRFRKPQRTLNLTATSNFSNMNNEQNTLNEIKYFQKGANIGDSLSNRLMVNGLNTRQISLTLNYTEPLGKKSYFDFSYGYNRQEQNNHFTTSEKKSNITTLIDSLSNINSYSSITQTMSSTLHVSSEKTDVSIGLSLQPNNTIEEYLDGNQDIHNNQLNFSPTAEFSYYISSASSFNLNYSGYNTLPTYSQLQPVADTRAIQNTIIGNPDLKTSFTHSLDFNYRHFGGSTFMFTANGGFSFIRNQIVTNTYVVPDTLGNNKLITSYENANGSYRINGGYQLSIPVIAGKSLHTELHLSGALDVSHNNVFSNSIRDINKNQTLNQSMSMQTVGESYSLSLGGSYTYTENTYKILPQAMPIVKSATFNIAGNWNITKATVINAEMTKSITSGFVGIDVPNALIINCSISQHLLRKKLLELTVSGNDLLNQGNAFYRGVNGISVVNTRNNFVTRNILISLTMHFNEFKTP